MPISVNSIISNPEAYRNTYNDYSPNNAYYNYYVEYRKHAHYYEPDYYERRNKEMEEERRKLAEFTNSYKKILFEEADAQIRNVWEKEKAAGKKPSQDMILSTEITDRDSYIEKYREEKESHGLDNCLNPLTKAEEKALREKWRLTPNNITMSVYNFMGRGLPVLDDNMVFWVEGVRFSKSEMEECHSIICKADDLLLQIGGNMDYRDYAKLGIAYNVVSTYAEENLTWAQQQVVKQGMAALLDSYIVAEQELFVTGDYIEVDDKFYNIREKETGARVISATNEELQQALRMMFGEVDLRDQKAVDKVLGQYKTIAGIVTGFSKDDSVKNCISSAKAILNSVGKKVDCSI